MKINGLPGEFAFKALFTNFIISLDGALRDGWRLSNQYYFSEEEVKSEAERIQSSYKWPVEVRDDGSVYIPSEEELK